MKIWDKGQNQNARLSMVRSERLSSRNKDKLNPQKDRMFQGRRREKENMDDFIQKKRDMFLIQMSLDTKRQEIQKLEEKAQMKEDALRKSEMMLEEDAMRFDAFLKENDRKAHNALKRADTETKQKQEKVSEIKKLNQEIAKVDAEMSKYEEQLNACLKYKKFLDDLTPPEHFAAVGERKVRRKQEKLAELQKENPGLKIDNVSSDEDPDEMYFKEPSQLLNIFAQIEERNLFLIQNVQETEEALEELKQKYEETKTQMEEKTAKLHSNIADLKDKIRVENEKADALAKRARANNVAGNQQKLLQGLSDKVKDVYSALGMDADTQTDILDMLREIENYLELLLRTLSKLDKTRVAEAEKRKEKERRNRVMKAKKLDQQRQQEERLAKSTTRAKAEVIRNTGKQVMFRSPPIKKKKKKEVESKKDDEAEDVKKFFT
mmetsp:Transcript_13986/g.27124  ORF Transcript_13986/g.27124 Transcript_13986/m.27124 type:complete len:435 (+) Transcript_13986:357-1661(+)